VGLIPPTADFFWAHCYAVHARVLPRLIAYLERATILPSGHPEGGKLYIDGEFTLFRRFNPDVVTLVANPRLSIQKGRFSSSTIVAGMTLPLPALWFPPLAAFATSGGGSAPERTSKAHMDIIWKRASCRRKLPLTETGVAAFGGSPWPRDAGRRDAPWEGVCHYAISRHKGLRTCGNNALQVEVGSATESGRSDRTSVEGPSSVRQTWQEWAAFCDSILYRAS
jgi:hypothetical protein